MDDRARAILDEAYETLHRVRNVTVERRDISQPDVLELWRAGMPEKEPEKEPAMTAGKIARMIADALDGYHETRAVTPKVAATIIHEVRQQLRREFASDLGKLRTELRKAVSDDRRLARSERAGLELDGRLKGR